MTHRDPIQPDDRRARLRRSLGLPLAVALLAVGTSACQDAEPPAEPLSSLESTATEPADPTTDWVDLFDGETFTGWRGIGREDPPTGHWQIEDGTLRKVATGSVPVAADGQPLEGGDLLSVGTWRDFEFSFEWKVAPGANSGIKYNVSEELSIASPPSRAALGFEYQVLDDDLHPDAQNGPNRQAGALYDLLGAGPSKTLRPVGEFNTGRILLIGNHGEHWLNGVKILEYDLESEDFAARLAASKYAPIAGFADRRAGHLVLQDHSDDVWFRNLRLRIPPQ